MKALLCRGLANAALLILPFLLVEGVFRLLPVSEPPQILPVTAETPVTRYEPNVDYRYSRDWNFSISTRKHSNNYGFIHNSDFHPGDTTPLLAVIGDSFVEANTVEAGRSVAELLHAGLRGKGRCYSVAMSGAPLSQYLVFAQYAAGTFHPRAMAFVIIGNDFDESLLKYKSEPRFHYFAEDGGATLRRVDYQLSTLKSFLRHSAGLRYVMHNLEAGHRLGELGRSLARLREDPYAGEALARRIEDSRRAVDHFLDRLPAMSSLGTQSIVFVLDAARPSMYPEETQPEPLGGYHSTMRRWFAAAARARGYEVIDLEPVFLRRHQLDGARFEAAPTDSHWNALGHQVAAEELRKWSGFSRVFGESPAPRDVQP